MKQVKYGDSSFLMRLEMPRSWDIENISAVTIGIKDSSATELLSAQSATLYTATTLNGALTATSMAATLANTATAVTTGDRLRIAASAAGQAEDIVVRSYNGSTYTIELDEELADAHSDGTAVHGMWATYAADFSDTDTYTAGKIIEVTWTPDSDDEAYTERYTVGKTEFAASQLWDHYSTLYPTNWETVKGTGNRNLDSLETLIVDLFAAEFKRRQLEIDRLRDQNLFHVGLLKFAHKTLLEDGGDSTANELEEAKESWVKWFEDVTKSTIWTDDDQDETLDEPEENYPRIPSFLTRNY